jgi:osmotically-inducible protein OsmY
MLKRFLAMLRIISASCLFAGVFAGVFAACNRTDTEDAVASDSIKERADREGMGRMTDIDLEKIIQARIKNDEQLKSADLHVKVNARQNEVTLSGVVQTSAMRDRAVDLARAARFGVVINDQIEIRRREISRSEYTEENAREEREEARKRGESIGDSLDDAWIHTKVVESLSGDSDALRSKINVDVRNNVVTLRGVVETPEQKASSERVAKDTEGVREVINQLKIEKPAGERLGAYYARR